MATTDDRLKKLEAWVKAAEGRNLESRVQALEAHSSVLTRMVDRLLLALEAVFGKGK